MLSVSQQVGAGREAMPTSPIRLVFVEQHGDGAIIVQGDVCDVIPESVLREVFRALGR